MTSKEACIEVVRHRSALKVRRKPFDAASMISIAFRITQRSTQRLRECSDRTPRQVQMGCSSPAGAAPSTASTTSAAPGDGSHDKVTPQSAVPAAPALAETPQAASMLLLPGQVPSSVDVNRARDEAIIVDHAVNPYKPSSSYRGVAPTPPPLPATPLPEQRVNTASSHSAAGASAYAATVSTTQGDANTVSAFTAAAPVDGIVMSCCNHHTSLVCVCVCVKWAFG